jgi:hypothetical protein
MPMRFLMLITLLLAPPAASVPSPAAHGLPLTVIAQGPLSDIVLSRQVVVRDEDAWQALWKEHGVTKLPPKVDFSSTMVVGVFLGSRPQSGYGVQISRAYTEGGNLVVEYVVRKPEPGAMTAQVVTAPYILVQVPEHAGPVRFVDASGEHAQHHRR